MIPIIQLLLLPHIIPIFSGDLILGCGLFGFIGTNPTKYFSWDKFNILGIMNDDRGEDACGRVVGNICEHGTGILKKYKDFIVDNHPPIEKVESNVILGHCRKASSGGKDAIYAQPVVLYKKDINMKAIKDTQLKGAIKKMKKDDIIFSGIHNGTVENYKELAKSYGIPTEDHNDSRVILTALFYGNYGVLLEYIGTAALVWHNHITNKTCVFKGASKYWVSSKDVSEERPLHFWVMDKDNYYLSSEDEPLHMIGGDNNNVGPVKDNVLYVFKDGVNIKNIKYDRSGKCQAKSYNSSNKNTAYDARKYYAYDDEPAFYDRPSTHKDSSLSLFKGHGSPSKGSTVSEDSAYAVGGKYIRKFHGSNPMFRIQAEQTDSYISKSVRRVVYNKTRYWLHGNLMHGAYILNPSGFVPNIYTREAILTKPYYFVEGVIMDGASGYKEAMKMHKIFEDNINDNVIDVIYLEQKFISDIARYSRYPVAPLLATTGDEMCFDSNTHSSNPTKTLFTGSFVPLFSSRKYSFDDGGLSSIIDPKEIKTASHDEEDSRMSFFYMGIANKSNNIDTPYGIGFKLLNFTKDGNPLSPFQILMATMYEVDTKADTDEKIKIFIIHYMRDFDQTTRDECKFCQHSDVSAIYMCESCEKLKVNLKTLANYATYGVY